MLTSLSHVVEVKDPLPVMHTIILWLTGLRGAVPWQAAVDSTLAEHLELKLTRGRKVLELRPQVSLAFTYLAVEASPRLDWRISGSARLLQALRAGRVSSFRAL